MKENPSKLGEFFTKGPGMIYAPAAVLVAAILAKRSYDRYKLYQDYESRLVDVEREAKKRQETLRKISKEKQKDKLYLGPPNP